MTRAEDRKQSLVEFRQWAEDLLPVHILNVQALKDANPVGISNPMLRFVVPRAMTHVVEHSCLRVVEAWEILNDELISQKMRGLGIKNRDYEHLKRIRNKLIAHRVPNELGGKRHQHWYKKSYGSFESVLGLIYRVAAKLAERIGRLQRAGRLPAMRSVQPNPPEFTAEYVVQVLNALKDHKLF